MKLLILIPSFNTHKYLDKLITLIRLQTASDILVVDDGSSPQLSLNYSDDKNVIIYRNHINKGKGNVIKYGINYAIGKNYTHLLTIDGDLQHNPNQINLFLNEANQIDFLLGYRSFTSPMPIQRILSNTITSFIISLLIEKKIYDSQCGYRRYKLKNLNNLSIDDNGYLFESEILLKYINKNSLVKNIKIDTIYHNSKSYIHVFKDTAKFLYLIVRYIFT